jgi:ADP-heptose:LPS heptosyltransferase
MKDDGYDIRAFEEIKAFEYSDTAKIVKSCDLVISVCTSVIHLAGALGVPCWVMVPNKPAWRYGVSGKMPWYSSVRLYRQKESWLPVVEVMAEDLRNLLEDLREKAA